MKLVVNEKYAALNSFIKKIPQNFTSIGTVIFKERNEIRKVECEGFNLNIKSYKIPILINRIAYAFVRPSKAKRAFEYAVRLTKLGFNTPAPVAYIECFENCLLKNSYFISIHNENAKEFRTIQYTKVDSEIEKLLTQMAAYNAKMHEANIIHCDYSPGNILFEKQGDDYKFSIIDINRMKFKKVGTREGMLNFGRLCLPDDKVVILAKSYAAARGINEHECIELMLANNKKNIIKYHGKENVEK